MFNVFCRNAELVYQTVLILTIQFIISQQILIIPVLQFITNSLINHQSFVYPQSNNLTVLFQTI